MKKRFLLLSFFIFFQISNAQVATIYTISFDEAVHHEAVIHVTFKDLMTDEVEFRMSRTSPGRYAIHEFAKNAYNVKVTDSKGTILKTTRPNPYTWKVSGHDGTIHISYTLFANRGGGTYTQIDETHAHLNIPATFMYMPSLSEKEIEITFNVRKDLNWKIATQLKHLKGNTYYAKDLQYFMDSPTEISDHSIRSFKVDGQTINFVLHHRGTETEFDAYFENVKKIVLQEKAVYGELPDFDYGVYTFLACYISNASGDGMEHRNSTILTSTRSLANDGIKRNIGTVSHEFFHSWNVERIRPKSLEPFNFEAVNMSGELWFAEGFTSYYTNLILKRSGLISEEEYVKGLQGTFNYVWNSPGRDFFNPIEMSYQAPFVDAATAVDEVNRRNTFISYYSYGSMLGLALDLSLREQQLNLDDYMKLVWNTFGKTAVNYTVDDLNQTLNSYAGKEFGNHFFDNYIYKSNMPDFKRLFLSVGIQLIQDTSKVAYFGVSLRDQKANNYSRFNSAAYNAGLTKGDKIIQLGNEELNNSSNLNDILSAYKPDDTLSLIYERYGETKETAITLLKNQNYSISLFEENDIKLKKKIKEHRTDWLAEK
ncbi:MAG: peptidase M61 [Flavobacteriaceae bacterium]|nr:MAG: peptidase M61 [Flavobacteriaceae bacterium]